MRSFIAITALCAALSFNPAFAQEATPDQNAVRIEMDQTAKAFVFIIDDEPVAMLDKSGLYVPGEINYGGTLTDTGPEAIQATITSKTKEAGHD